MQGIQTIDFESSLAHMKGNCIKYSLRVRLWAANNRNSNGWLRMDNRRGSTEVTGVVFIR